MAFNDALARALAQAREMQKQAIEAANTAAEQMRPHIAKSLENAKEMQATLNEHAAESGAFAAQQAHVALGHLSDYIKMGTEAMRESADATRSTAVKMAEESKKIVEAATEAMTKAPDA
jgi:DNA anti-recombination protein RmuC